MKVRVKLQAVVKNEALVQARLEKGYDNITLFVEVLNAFGQEREVTFSYGHYMAIENMKINPGPKRIKLLCDFFEMEPEILFPGQYNKYVKALKNMNKKTEAVIEAQKLISGVENKKISFIQEELTISIKEALKTLDDREKNILECRFFEDMTLEETGKKWAISRDRVRQIESKALRKLRHPTRSQDLRDFVTERR